MRAHRQELIITLALFGFGLLLWFVSPLPDTHLPPPSDLAFHELIELRQIMLAQASNSLSILVALGAVTLASIWAAAFVKRRLQQALSASIVIVSLVAALQAQSFIMRGQHEDGVLLYLIAGASFLAWIPLDRAVARRNEADVSSSGLPRRGEIIALTLVLAVTLFARVYDLKRMPYGIDGDESKWTVEVVKVVIDGADLGGSEYHRRYLPMSFWMQAPFHWLMGAGLTSGRVAVAFFSVIGSFVFYRLVRELYDAPTALIATLLLAVSLLDVTASRAGNVESHVKLWALLPLLGLAVALRTREVRHFALAGFGLAGAMLTYETLMPIVATTLLLAIGAALRERHAWHDWIRRLAALLTAPAAVSFVAADYLLGRMQYYTMFRDQAEAFPFGEQLLRGVEGLLQPFYSRPLFDALYRRDGPIVNGLLVPLLVLGILYAIANLRRRGNAFSLTWLAMAFVPVPLVLHTPLPRVLYPGMAVLYIFIALALVTVFRAAARAVRLPRLSAALGMLVLGSFVLLNLTIWFHEATDSHDELRRREIGEIAAAYTGPGGLLLMPYFLPGETLSLEQDLMALMIRERHGTADAGRARAIVYDELLPTLWQESANYAHIDVLYDSTPGDLLAERKTIIETFRRCYPNLQTTNTTYFELYRATGHDLTDPACHSAQLDIAPPPPIVKSAQAASIAIGWALDAASATQSTLTCESAQSDVLWLEAESFGDLSGWIASQRFVTGWQGEGYLADAPNSDYAATTIDVPQSGTYHIWVRSYRRQADDFPAQLWIDERALTFAATDASALNAWQWQSLAALPLQEGPLLVQLRRPFDMSRVRFMALFVDTILVSQDPNFDPRRDDRWSDVLNMHGAETGPRSEGAFNVDLAAGRYRCRVTVSDEDQLVDESGMVGIVSDPIYFEVIP